MIAFVSFIFSKLSEAYAKDPENKHLAGQYGNDNVTIQNLEIVRVDLERNAILIKGAIPGPKGSIVTIADSVKSK